VTLKRKQIQPSDRKFIDISEHFIGSITATQGGVFGLSPVLAGTGATLGILAGESGANGVLRNQTGSTASGSSAIRSALSLLLSAGNWSLNFRVRIPVLSNATQRFTAIVGFGDTATVTFPLQGAIVYHDVNSGFWQLMTRNGGSGTQTIVVTTTPVIANSWHEMTIQVGGGIATFVVGGILYNISTTLPTTATNILFSIFKGAGLSSSFFEIDFIGLRIEQ
jgi:hypothetical protein